VLAGDSQFFIHYFILIFLTISEQKRQIVLTQNLVPTVAIWIVHVVAAIGILPQILLNYKIKSTAGLSNTYISIYISGYIFHLFYIFCLDLPIAYKIMNPLLFSLVLVLALQRIIYNKNKAKHHPVKLYCMNFFIIFFLIALAINFPAKIGHLAGWISLTIWTVYQLPQVFKIYSKKSVVGFSFAAVSVGGFQNLLGFAAVLALGLPLQTIFTALRGIIFFAIFCFQFWIYKNKSNSIAL
jgi:uncharacterized protein with PQ loop repeat